MTGIPIDICYEAVTQVYYIAIEAVMRERKYAGLAGLAYFVMMRFMYRIPYGISNLTAYGLAVFAAFAVMWLSERKISLRQKNACS